MNPLIGAALIMAASSAGSAAMEKQPEADYGKQLENWIHQQEYNSPANQVARLRAAGLNPNLLYGNGVTATGNASSGPYGDITPITSHQNKYARMLNAVSNALGTFLNLKGQAEQQELQKVSTLASIQHSKDALDFEQKKFAIDQAFRDTELRLREKELGMRNAQSDRQYNLSLSKWNWEKEHIDTYGTKPGTTMDWFSRLLSNVAGKPVTDVGTDTNRLLGELFRFGFVPFAQLGSWYFGSKVKKGSYSWY